MPPFLTCKELCWNRSSKGAVLEQNLLQNHPGEIGSIPLTPQAVEVLIMIHPPLCRDKKGTTFSCEHTTEGAAARESGKQRDGEDT